MIYRKLKEYAPERLAFAAIGIVLAFLAALLSIASYYMLYRFLVKIIADGDIRGAVPAAFRIAALLVANTAVYFLSLWATHALGFRLETNLKKLGIRRLMQASFSFYDRNDSGRIRKIIDDNTVLTHMSVAHLIPDLSTAVFVPVLGAALAFAVDVKLGVLFLVTLLLGLYFIQRMMGDRQFMKRYMEAQETMNAGAVEYVRGIHVLKIFRMNAESLREFHRAVLAYSDLALRYSMSCRRWYVVFQVFFNAVYLTAMFFYSVRNGEPREFLAKFMFYVMFHGILFISFMKVMYVGMYLFQANSAIGKIETLFREMEEKKLPRGTAEKMDSFDIEFRDVTFSYGEERVIENLSLTLPAGRSYALVGSSGSGKTTLAKLISGFYQTDGGEIRIGGRALSEYSDGAFARNIANVFQDARLFQDTIYENVRAGRRSASREEVMEALHLAQCDEILGKFAGREETVIGSEGVHLSGGEMQRITIARAILKNAGIVILDEASAAADPENEYELQRALANLMKGRTVIMIAHRLSSIRNVDEILVIENGRVAERGSHGELMRGDTRYRRLQEEFMRANEWRVRGEAAPAAQAL
ncbi:ABC transporter ATP-binding protein [Lachnoclostridium sp. Marseille-P6806]|uniref:ABC transporter ATP-binding protein n=1 Tax=Lachnoclostridium sp. Marseille-P6806 TaxID=2364793 RepID=UPI00103064A1|nr:ABC transporter ATP-binding protein [Lachnoclostridium sp. Marseille-P6806]